MIALGGRMIHLDVEAYIALVKGEFSLRPCAECDSGTIYVDGNDGEVISKKTYKELEEVGHKYLYSEVCSSCYGLGKVVQYNN